MIIIHTFIIPLIIMLIVSVLMITITIMLMLILRMIIIKTLGGVCEECTGGLFTGWSDDHVNNPHCISSIETS